MPNRVTQGVLLVDRFRLDSPEPSDLPYTSAWVAYDKQLGRHVRALVIDGPMTDRVIDGARRAALVEDPRLLQIIGVFEDDEISLIVTDFIYGTSLAELLREGPIDSKRARTIAGEVAQALSGASARGVHHLGLRPAAIYQVTDGSIMVSGTGFDGILLGEDVADPIEAERVDTIALVALIYTMLTGLWPGAETLGGTLPIATRTDAGPTPPADIAKNIPNDLDTLCGVTLGPNHDGPHTPAELSDELAPWITPMAGPESSGLIGVTLSSEEVVLQESSEFTGGLVGASPLNRPSSHNGAKAQHGSSRGFDGAEAGSIQSEANHPSAGGPWAPVAGGTVTGGQRRINIHSSPGEVEHAMSDDPNGLDEINQPSFADQDGQDEAASFATGAMPEDDQYVGESTAEASGIVAATTHPETHKFQQPPVVPAARPAPARKQALSTQPAASPSSAPTAPPLGVNRDGVPTRRSAMDGFAAGNGVAHAVAAASSRTPPPAAPARPVRSPYPRTGTTGMYASGLYPVTPAGGVQPGVSQPGVITPGAGQPGYPGQDLSGADLFNPEMGFDPGNGVGSPDGESDGDYENVTRRRFDPTKVVIAASVVVILVIGVFALSSILKWDFSLPGFGGATQSESPTANPSTEKTTEVIAGPATIIKAESLDPYGDNNEHPETVDRVLDGDANSMWSTRYYNQPNFGGKSGVGLRLTFDGPVKVEQITLTTPGSGGSIKVMTDVPNQSGEGTVIGEGSFTAPTSTIKVSHPDAVTSVVIWFSQAPQAPDGKNRVDVAEAAVN